MRNKEHLQIENFFLSFPYSKLKKFNLLEINLS
jgi:hypothetical protein